MPIFMVPVVVGTAIALIGGFATTVFLTGVAAISTSLLILGGIGALATSFVVMASFAFSVFLAGLAVVCAPFILMASFAFSAVLAGLTAICSALLFRAFLYVTGQPAPHFLGFINRTPLFRGLTFFATKLTFLGASGGARAALIGASVTAGLAQTLRVKKKLEQDVM